MASDFEIGAFYKYATLMDSLEGGSHQFYLPYRKDRVFAAFLNKSKNPEAPRVILVGSKKKVAYAGALLLRQEIPIPVFVKHATDKWCFEGYFKTFRLVDEPSARAMAKEAKRDDVAFAIELHKTNIEALPLHSTFEEGKCGQVTRNVYERNPDARLICLQHYGYRCNVCDIQFEDEYGDVGKNFIHVHHLNPLHLAEGKAQTNPIEDLRPVCANCHAMIHAHGGLLTPEELRERYWSLASQQARKSRADAYGKT